MPRGYLLRNSEYCEILPPETNLPTVPGQERENEGDRLGCFLTLQNLNGKEKRRKETSENRFAFDRNMGIKEDDQPFKQTTISTWLTIVYLFHCFI